MWKNNHKSFLLIFPGSYFPLFSTSQKNIYIVRKNIYAVCFISFYFSIKGSQKDVEYKLAQSGDASCNGLESAEVSNRNMAHSLSIIFFPGQTKFY
jgi:hypothetical protein